jgi:hypothetical protein
MEQKSQRACAGCIRLGAVWLVWEICPHLSCDTTCIQVASTGGSCSTTIAV